jgi:hypothetical protein
MSPDQRESGCTDCSHKEGAGARGKSYPLHQKIQGLKQTGDGGEFNFFILYNFTREHQQINTGSSL